MKNPHIVRDATPGSACIYCNNELSGEWVSDFSGPRHYKRTICACGRENCVGVGFIGTGHDGWGGLEKKVSEAPENLTEKSDF